MIFCLLSSAPSGLSSSRSFSFRHVRSGRGSSFSSCCRYLAKSNMPFRRGASRLNVPESCFALLSTSLRLFSKYVETKLLEFLKNQNVSMLGHVDQCGGPDLNRRIPMETDLESVAFGQARQPPPEGELLGI